MLESDNLRPSVVRHTAVVQNDLIVRHFARLGPPSRFASINWPFQSRYLAICLREASHLSRCNSSVLVDCTPLSQLSAVRRVEDDSSCNLSYGPLRTGPLERSVRFQSYGDVMVKAWRYLCIAFITVGCVLSIRFMMLFWEKPWPHPILTIDGQSYMKGAAGATWATLFKLHDLYHSPGYQIYLRFLFAALGSPKAVTHASKLLSLLMFFASAVLLYRLGRRWFEPAVAQIVVALFLFSESWRYYCNMIQYEVLTGFLMLLFLSMLMSAESSSSPKISRLYGIGMGFVLAFISLIQMRYVVLLLIPLIYSLIQRKSLSIHDWRQNGIILLTALVLLAVWSFAQSLDHGRTVFLMEGSEFRFHVANNPNAVGYSFPYPDIVEPSGWQFVLWMPRQWLWLIGQRALYLSGIKRDIWALPPQGFRSGPIGSYSLLDLISVIVFVTGLILAMSRVRRRRELSDEPKAGILLLACVMLPALFIFGSKRFIVPVIPLIALFQGYAIVATARGLLGRSSDLSEVQPRGVGTEKRRCSLPG